MNPHSFGARAPVIQGFFNGGRPPLTLQAHAGHGGRPGGRGRPPVAQPFGSGSAFQVPSTVRLAGRGSGQPLPPIVLQRMEEFFGTSFADVRVHVGPQAASIGALAFTMGADLYFAPGQYDPHGAHGQRLLAHELTHVVQQRAGRVRNPLGGGVAVVQDPALEAEAERMGTRLRAMPPGAAVQARMSGAQATASLAPRPSHGRGGAAQSYRVQPPVQGPNGRMRIRATLPGSAGEAGSVNIRPTRSGLLEITDLYVAPAHRRQGLGSRLMQAALRTGRSQGVGGAVLEARPSDAGISALALQAMYERMGFRTMRLSARGTPIMQFGAGAVQPRMALCPNGAIQRAEAADDTGYDADTEWQVLGSRNANQGAKVFHLANKPEEGEKDKLKRFYATNPGLIREPRSYAHQREVQTLRWLATVLLAHYGGVEVQCYYDVTTKTIYVSSNKNDVNEKMAEAVKKGTTLIHEMHSRHFRKLKRGMSAEGLDEAKMKYAGEIVIKNAISKTAIVVCPEKYEVDLHAERRIQQHLLGLGKELDPDYLAGTKRPCMVCAVALGLTDKHYPGPMWTTNSGLGGMAEGDVISKAKTSGLYSYITKDHAGHLSYKIGSESDSE